MRLTGRPLVVVASLLFVICLVPIGWAAYSAVVYFTTDPRFEVQKLSVSGLKRVEENQVLAKAGFEVGTNVFHVKLEKIRERVEELPWVRHALVERVLPDKIMIKIVEREPIGLARINGDVFQFDIDGKILDPDSGSGSSFPILDGLRTEDHKGNVEKLDVYRRVVEDLGQTALSEIHINDSQEVTVVSASDPLLVNLGTVDFRTRWIKYLQLKPQIQQKYPQAVRVDLRFRNQVIVRVNNDETGENIVWGGKKSTL
jgi:cell division septal protein FtsQ